MPKEVDIRMIPANIFIIVKTQEVTKIIVSIEMVKQTIGSPCGKLSIGLQNKIGSVL